ncbi:MAG: glycosyl hydrolase, partial [bacterium]
VAMSNMNWLGKLVVGSVTLPLTYDQFDIVKVFIMRAFALGGLAAWSFQFFFKGGKLRRTKLDWLIVGFLGWVLLTSFTSISPATALFGKYRRFEGFFSFLTYAVVYFLVVQLADRPSRIRSLARTFMISGIIVAGYGVLQYLGLDPVSWGANLPFEANRGFSTFGNPDLLGGFLIFPLAVSVSLALSERETGWRIFYWSTFLVTMAAWITAFVRGAWLGGGLALILVIIAAVLARPKLGSVDWSFAGLTGAAGAGLVVRSLANPNDVLNVWERLQSIFKFGEGSALTRFEIWEAAINAVKAKPITGFGADTFRLVFPKLAAPARLAEVTLHGEALVNGWDGKAGFRLTTDFRNTPALAVPDTATLKTNDVIDVTACLKGDTLTWDVPEGNWVILRLGHSPTGKRNGPAPEGASGLECDKLDREAVRAYYTAFLEPLKQKLGPLFGKPGFNAVLADSWEAGVQNWTSRFIEAFKQKRGYSPIPYLPVMTGRVVGSAEISERFLWDIRRTIGDLVAECFYGEAQKICEENGLLFYSEAPGVGLALADAMQCKSRVAVPMGEFWVCSASQGPDYYMRHPLNNDDCKEAASAAHLAGRAVVAAESFTAGTHSPWQQYPATMKAEGDFYFAQGINRFFFHTYAHQPWANRAPGMTMSRFGTHLGRTVTWWQDGAPSYMTYLARCQFLLQCGRSVSDFALFISEDVPGGLRLSKDPALQPPEGFDFDACGAETLLDGFTVTDGALTLPHGVRYKALVLAKSTRMTLPLAKKVASLVRDGATVIGPALAETPGLSDYPTGDAAVRAISRDLWGEGTSDIDRKVGKGRVLWNSSLSNACARLALQPDVELQSSTNTSFRWIHRVDNDSDIYFVANQQDRDVTATVTFRVSGKRPERWNPVTGETSGHPVYRVTADNRTEVSLSFASFESSFIVFRTPPTTGERSNEKQNSEVTAPMPVNTPWTVTFDPAHGGPSTPQPFAVLADWTQSSLDSIKYYSGTAVYTTTFDCPQPDQAAFLDLWKVQNIAAVKLNGHALGTVWTAPWRVKISGLLKETDNVLEIRVTNLWPNRINGDQALPEEKHIAKLVFAPLIQSFYKKDTPLLSSGLLGPVTVIQGINK